MWFTFIKFKINEIFLVQISYYYYETMCAGTALEVTGHQVRRGPGLPHL